MTNTVMTCEEVLEAASRHLQGLAGHTFDLLDLSKPVSPRAASNLAKVISKLSPLLGNLIEFNTVELLNDQTEFHGIGRWERQDPGFPDTIFVGPTKPTLPEIKAWFLWRRNNCTKDSQSHFEESTPESLFWPGFENLVSPARIGRLRGLGTSVAL